MIWQHFGVSILTHRNIIAYTIIWGCFTFDIALMLVNVNYMAYVEKVLGLSYTILYFTASHKAMHNRPWMK